MKRERRFTGEKRFPTGDSERDGPPLVSYKETEGGGTAANRR